MDKNLFTSIINRLNLKAPVLRWVDAEEGQLSSAQRPPVAFPCALVDISYIDCKTIPGSFGQQKIKASITVRVAFQRLASVNAAAPTKSVEHACRIFDGMQSIHKALQWWNGNGLFNPLSRVRCIPEKRSGDLKIYTMIYETEFKE